MCIHKDISFSKKRNGIWSCTGSSVESVNVLPNMEKQNQGFQCYCMTLKWLYDSKTILACLGGLNVVTRERGRQNRRDNMDFIYPNWLWRWMKKVICKGKQVASISLKVQRVHFYVKLPEEMQSGWDPWFQWISLISQNFEVIHVNCLQHQSDGNLLQQQ
jgi:hypothetical protein